MTQLDLFAARKTRDRVLEQVRENSGDFTDEAKSFVVDYLSTRDSASGEDITDACKAAGIVPEDDRSFGPVFMSLSRGRTIEKCGTCQRRKGNATSGGNVWRLRR